MTYWLVCALTFSVGLNAILAVVYINTLKYYTRTNKSNVRNVREDTPLDFTRKKEKTKLKVISPYLKNSKTSNK